VKNRHIFRAHISERKFRQIVRLFVLDLNAVQIADLTRRSRVSINRYLSVACARMAWLCEQAAPMGGEVEVDEILLRRAPPAQLLRALDNFALVSDGFIDGFHNHPLAFTVGRV